MLITYLNKYMYNSLNLLLFYIFATKINGFFYF